MATSHQRISSTHPIGWPVQSLLGCVFVLSALIWTPVHGVVINYEFGGVVFNHITMPGPVAGPAYSGSFSYDENAAPLGAGLGPFSGLGTAYPALSFEIGGVVVSDPVITLVNDFITTSGPSDFIMVSSPTAFPLLQMGSCTGDPFCDLWDDELLENARGRTIDDFGNFLGTVFAPTSHPDDARIVTFLRQVRASEPPTLLLVAVLAVAMLGRRRFGCQVTSG